jgi:hypothetical protein
MLCNGWSNNGFRTGLEAEISVLQRAGGRWPTAVTRDGIRVALTRFNAGVDATLLAALPERFPEQ